MSTSSTAVVLMSAGAVATVAGVLMYVLPGPGFPVLVLGLACATAGAALRMTNCRRSGACATVTGRVETRFPVTHGHDRVARCTQN